MSSKMGSVLVRIIGEYIVYISRERERDRDAKRTNMYNVRILLKGFRFRLTSLTALPELISSEIRNTFGAKERHFTIQNAAPGKGNITMVSQR